MEISPYNIRTFTKRDVSKIANLWIKTDYADLDPDILRKHLSWKYNEKFMKVWISEKDSKIIGTCGLFTVPLMTKNGIIDGGWGVDSLTDPSYRRGKDTFAFFRVYRNVVIGGYRDGTVKLTLCFPNQVVADTYLKTGWIDIPTLFQFSKILSPRNFVRDVIRNKSDVKFQRIANYKIGYKKYDNLIEESCVLKEADIYDKRIDNLWEKVSHKYSLVVIKEREYLNWRYNSCPSKDYILLLAERDKEIFGYVILREEKRDNLKEGYIVDILTDPFDKDKINYLISNSVEYFKKRNADIVNCVFSHVAYKKALLKQGFSIDKKIDFFVYSRKKELLKSLLKDSAEWHITMGDGDFDMEY